MLNPIFSKLKYILIYSLIWIITIAIHASWLIVSFQINVEIAIIESLVFNLLYAIIALLIWYSLFFIKGKHTPTLQIVINHVALALIITLFWMYLACFILHFIFLEEYQYIEFLEASYAFRFVSGVFYFLFTALAYYLVDYSRELKEKIQNEVVLKQAVQEAELKALKSQINPHFLFNSLNSISSLTLTEAEKAHSMIIKLSDYLRYSISNSQNKKVKFSDELKNINRYLEIEKIRFGKRLNYNLDIAPECENLLIPNMILQPLYENAIKYGVHESLEPISIKTDCSFKNNILSIEISNNFDEESYTTKKGEGVGLENISKRLVLIYKQYNLLKVEKKENIFKVYLNIPQN